MSKPNMTDRLGAIERFVEHTGLAPGDDELPEQVLIRALGEARNGNGSEPEPERLEAVDSYREAAPLLRRPFTAAAVKFKVQATWPKEQPATALIVSYIDARLVIERLNLVCPHLWDEPQYEPTSGGQMWCRLRVDGITRSDVGEGVGKGLVSDALKRAAVHFGVGVSLYATPKIHLKTGENHVKAKGSRQGPTLVLTDAGESRCREIYGAWLANAGIQAYGEPLDHGDVVGAVGDHEAEVEEEAPTPSTNRGNGPAPGRGAQGAPQQAQEPERPDPEVELARVLAIDDEFTERRKAANEGMAVLGAPPMQRLRELSSVTDERAIDALLARVNNAADGGQG